MKTEIPVSTTPVDMEEGVGKRKKNKNDGIEEGGNEG